MKPELKKALAKVRQAVARLEKAEGRIAIRNARRALFGATRSVEYQAAQAYPIPAKKPTMRSKTLLGIAESSKGLKALEGEMERLLKEDGYVWDLFEVQLWVNLQKFEGRRKDWALGPITTISSLRSRTLPHLNRCFGMWKGSVFPMDLPAEYVDEKKLVWIIHRMAHLIMDSWLDTTVITVKMVELFQNFHALAWREEIQYQKESTL